MDAKGSGSGNESNFGMDANDNLLTQCLAQSPSNTNLDNTTQALVMPPGTTASGGSGGPATRAQTSSQFDEGSVKSEGVGKVAGGKRGAPASQSSQPKKAPKLEIPEQGLLNMPTASGPLSMSDGSPGSLVAALSSTQGGSGDDGSPGTIQIPLDPTSSSNSLLADTFLTTPTSTLFQNPISPLGQGGELSWPDSKSPSSTANASKAMGPNAFPDPKKK